MSELKNLQKLYKKAVNIAAKCGVVMLRDVKCYFYDAERGNSFGCASQTQIYVDRAMFYVQSDDENMDTILHEICHVAADPSTGHGRAWKSYCNYIREKYPRYPLDKNGTLAYDKSIKAEKLRKEWMETDPLVKIDGLIYPTTLEFA